MASGSPVIAVASHVDVLARNGGDIGEPHLRDKLGIEGKSTLADMIYEEIFVDAYQSNGRGIQELSRWIIKKALDMEVSDIVDSSESVPLVGRKVCKQNFLNKI